MRDAPLVRAELVGALARPDQQGTTDLAAAAQQHGDAGAPGERQPGYGQRAPLTVARHQRHVVGAGGCQVAVDLVARHTQHPCTASHSSGGPPHCACGRRRSRVGVEQPHLRHVGVERGGNQLAEAFEQIGLAERRDGLLSDAGERAGDRGLLLQLDLEAPLLGDVGGHAEHLNGAAVGVEAVA